MPFQEKSAWIMSFALILCGIFYFSAVKTISDAAGELTSPVLPLVAMYTVGLIAVAIIGQIAIAIFSPKDANAPLDERERDIFLRASHYSGYVLATGVVMALGFYLLSYSGDVLFYTVFASLMISQLADYGFRIFLYRTAL